MLGGELHREIKFLDVMGIVYIITVLHWCCDSGAMCLSVGKCGTRCRNRT